MYLLSAWRSNEEMPLGLYSSKDEALNGLEKIRAHFATLPVIGNIVRLNDRLSATFFHGEEQIQVCFDIAHLEVTA